MENECATKIPITKIKALNIKTACCQQNRKENKCQKVPTKKRNSNQSAPKPNRQP